MKKLELFFNNLIARITFPFIHLMIIIAKDNPFTRKLCNFADKWNRRWLRLKGYDV